MHRISASNSKYIAVYFITMKDMKDLKSLIFSTKYFAFSLHTLHVLHGKNRFLSLCLAIVIACILFRNIMAAMYAYFFEFFADIIRFAHRSYRANLQLK